MKIFKITAFDAAMDTVYVQAADRAGAKARLVEMIGDIPDSFIKIEEVSKLPADEEIL